MTEIKSEAEQIAEFLAFASSRGFDITSPELDGGMHRFDAKSKGSGWYVGSCHETRKGHPFVCVTFGDWVGGEKYVFKPDMRLSPLDREDIKYKEDKAKQQAAQEKEKLRDEAAAKATKMIASCPAAKADHSYLQRKKIEIEGAFQCGDALMLPTKTLKGSVTGAQFIDPDGKKRFMLGQRIKGCVFVFGALETSWVIYLCEGVATGATIYMATGDAVVCAFNASNLKQTAIDIKASYPAVQIIVAGDDDHATEGNPGKTKATEASKTFLGAPIFPVFAKYDGKNTTDFNDLHVIEGLKVVQKQFEQRNEMSAAYQSLGINGSYHFFYSLVSNTILKFKSFTSDNLLQLMTLKDLKEKFSSDEGVDWDAAKDFFIQESMNKGIYSPSRIRGVGVWKDSGATIVNTGPSILVNGADTQRDQLESNYHYVSSANCFHVSDSPLQVSECRDLFHALTLFQWEKPESIALLSGWLAIARVCGALPIRPHIWITAGEGVGKSTLFEGVVVPALGGSEGFLAAKGQTTSAGIRQALKGDAIPVIYDEFETESHNAIQRGSIELMRQSWSNSCARVYKGTTSGVAMDFDVQFPALVSSIKVNLENAQDAGRFCVLELSRHDGNADKSAQINLACEKITSEFGNRLFSRSVGMIDVILESYKTIKREILGLKHSSRTSDQIGMLLAGYCSLISDTPVTRERARELIVKIGLSENDLNDTHEKDEELCLGHLLTSKVRFTIEGTQPMGCEATIGSLIASNSVDSLQNFGLTVTKDNFLGVIGRHAELAKIFSSTHWKNWNHSLARLPGVEKRKTIWLKGVSGKGVKIPLSTVLNPEDNGGCKSSLVTAPKASYVLSRSMLWSDASFGPGTPVELIPNMFGCEDMTQLERDGFSRQLKKDSSLKVVRVGGRYRTLAQEDFHTAPDQK